MNVPDPLSVRTLITLKAHALLARFVDVRIELDMSPGSWITLKFICTIFREKISIIFFNCLDSATNCT